MPTLKNNKANHQAFFSALAKLAYDHGASIEALVEDASIEGNVLASGDDDADAAAKAEVIAQLEAGKVKPHPLGRGNRMEVTYGPFHTTLETMDAIRFANNVAVHGVEQAVRDMFPNGARLGAGIPS